MHKGVFKEGQLGYGSCMQTIYPTSLTPNQYAEQEHHKQVKAPVNCPNCPHRPLFYRATAAQ
jgi:TPP-dependent indolepyruvate ferredoxin oxidoreductase alpha subunit